MLAIFNCASAASGMLGKKVSKSLYSISAWARPAVPPSAYQESATRQLGAGDEFRIGIGVDQGLQGHPGHVEAVVLHRIHGAVEQNLVGLLGVNVGHGILTFLLVQATVNRQRAQQIAMTGIRRDIRPRERYRLVIRQRLDVR